LDDKDVLELLTKTEMLEAKNRYIKKCNHLNDCIDRVSSKAEAIKAYTAAARGS